QYPSLQHLKKLRQKYPFHITPPPTNFKQPLQCLYLPYLPPIKQQNPPPITLPPTSTFLHIYPQPHLQNPHITQQQLQQIIHHFIIKLPILKFPPTPQYNQLFSPHPTS
ncbi:pyruvate formate lyase family protein, partial [Staphylococcus epidermidis]|uniref:pyruvate formate lyase family protein n=1 Tax=Staphylococcus epidermidis TaxID=1282 RepID=UPI0037D9EC39